MAYTRKTIDRWDIETNWGYGWEAECSEYAYKEAKVQYRTYIENVGNKCGVRMTKHREKKDIED